MVFRKNYPKQWIRIFLHTFGLNARRLSDSSGLDLRAFGYQLYTVNDPGLIEMTNYLLARFLYFERLYKTIQNIDGDIVECGIGKGRTFFMLCCLAEMDGKRRNVWGFDSFEGFPRPSSSDNSPRQIQKGEYSILTENGMRQILRKGGLGKAFINERVKLVKGFFNQSLPKFQGQKVAFLHLDVDLYQSYKETLEFFWPKVVSGGIVLFDEYKQPGMGDAFPGAARAIDEFFGGLKHQIQFDKSANRYYLIKK
jgi:hypothetical protein